MGVRFRVGQTSKHGVRLDKRSDHLISGSYQKVTSDAVNALLEVLENLDEKSYNNFDNKFKTVIEKSLSIKRTIDKRATKQLELF